MASATCAALVPLPTISTLQNGASVGRRMLRNRLAMTKAARVHTLNAHISIPEPCAGDDPKNMPAKTVGQATARHVAAVSHKVVFCATYKSSSIAKARKADT